MEKKINYFTFAKIHMDKFVKHFNDNGMVLLDVLEKGMINDKPCFVVLSSNGMGEIPVEKVYKG